MTIINPLPNNINNGDALDASAVMANFNQIVNNVNASAAGSGTNNDILQLAALSTPITIAQGGTGLVSAAHLFLKATVFSASGTWTPDTRMGTYEYELVGGGGAGGGAAVTSGSQASTGNAGGNGTYSRGGATITPGSLGAQTVTVGAGGTGNAGATGGAGGASSIGTLATAPGGNGGPTTLVAQGGGGTLNGPAPSSAGTATIMSIPGAVPPAMQEGLATGNFGPGGMPGVFGGNAQPVGASSTNGNAAPASPGVGGGGTRNYVSASTTPTGGAGYKGIVIIREYT